VKCGFCLKDLEAIVLQTVGFRSECPHCKEDLHSCINCQFYDPKVYNECKETSADVVREKKRANYCDYFKFTGSQGYKDNAKDLKSAAEALFKKN